MTSCPKCAAPERPDHQSVVDVGSKMRLACLMGHSRWVELSIVTLAPRAIGKHEVSNRMYPPRDCLRCGFPIVPRLALNQKRHGRCAALETAERRRGKARAVNPLAFNINTPTPKRTRVRRDYAALGRAMGRSAQSRKRAAAKSSPEPSCASSTAE